MASNKDGSAENASLDPVKLQVDRALDVLVDKNDLPLALGVSGGSDSIALLHLMTDWAARGRRNIFVATVDHGLRPEAKEEAAWVGERAAKLGAVHTTLTWRPPSGHKISQAQAREARHKLLYDWCGQIGARQLFLGHTQSDALETCLMRARAGSRWFGLAGLAAANAPPAWPNGSGLQLARPMLTLSRAALKAWLADQVIDWIDDPSNDNHDFERIRTRAVINALSPKAQMSLQNSLVRIQQLRKAEISALRDVISKSARVNPDGAISIPLEAVRSLSPERRSRLICWLAMCASGAPSQPRSALGDSLGGLISAQDIGGQTLGDAWCAWDDAEICFYRRPIGESRTEGAPQSGAEKLSPGMQLVWDGRFIVTASSECPPGHIVTFDQAVQSGLQISNKEEMRKLGDARARRSLPVLAIDDQRAVGPSTSPKAPMRIAEMVSKRLTALADERSATDI